MFVRAIRLPRRLFYPQFHALCSPPFPDDTIFTVSALLREPEWQKNQHLKSLVSHLSPYLVPKIVSIHSSRGDVPLCLDFIKWVCKHSTYCYNIESRIKLMYLLASDNLHGFVDKVMVYLIKEWCMSEDEITKLIDAIDHLRLVYGFWVNYSCYSMLLVHLAKLNLGLMSFFLLRRMCEDGFVASGIDYRNVINALCKNGHSQPAEMLVSRVLKSGFSLDVHIHASLILGSCRIGNLNEAFRVFALMSGEGGCGVNSATYSILVHGLCESGRLDEACRLKDDMSGKGCRPTTRTFTVLIKAMCDKGLTDRAFSLLDEMRNKGCEPNVYTYTVLVDMLCREGKIDEANGMFRKMLEDGLSPGIVTFNALINGYCKEGRLVSAFELLGVMERKHCKPNIRTYNELMEGLCKSGRPFRAVALLRKVIGIGLFPTDVTFNILVDGLFRAGELSMAIEILRSMSSIGIEPDRYSYTALINTLCQLERPEEASVVLGLMVKKGISIDEVILTALIHGYCKIGKSGSAFLLFKRVIEDGFFSGPHIFNVFLDFLGKERDVGAKNTMLGKLFKYGLVPSVVTYTILVDGICQAGDVPNCHRMLDVMRASGCPPNIHTYTVVISGLCQSGKSEHAEKFLVEMRKDGVFPNVVIYSFLVKMHVAAGRMSHTFDVVETMLRDGCSPNDQIYVALLSGFMMMESSDSKTGWDHPPNLIFKTMEVQHALWLIDKLTGCGDRPTDVYKFLITGLCKVGRMSETDILIRDMARRGLSTDSGICDCIVRHLREKGDYDGCVEWMDRLGAYASLSTYSDAIVGLRSVGRIQEAEGLISQLVRNGNIEDRGAIEPYIGFLVKGDPPDRCFELQNLLQQMRCAGRN